MTGWYVVSTHANQEGRAQVNLERQGFKAWLPALLRSRRHARRIDTVRAPMFPGYLFVRLDPERDRWFSINGTLGVRRLLCHGDRPARVPDGFVDALYRTLDKDGLSAMPDGCLQPGALVRVVAGPFVDCVGTLMHLASSERVALLLRVLNRDVATVMSRRWVAPAA